MPDGRKRRDGITREKKNRVKEIEVEDYCLEYPGTASLK